MYSRTGLKERVRQAFPMLKRHPYGPCWKELALGGAEKVAVVTRRMLAYPKGVASGKTRLEDSRIISGRNSKREEEGVRTTEAFSSWRVFCDWRS